MNRHIEQLYLSAKKSSRLIIGLMSGTSLDGLDVALCRIQGQGTETQIQLLEFCTVDYDDNYKQKVKSVFAQRQVDLQQVTLLHPWIGILHGQMINQCLAKWQIKATDIDAIASHGQTIYHCPLRQHGLSEFG
ncbi:anhydro-N-acetylmuramic acid kinase, partial [Paraglaciecola sp.]|uniref:anhydro-N-acetylmuramic acid kinase n=1 Tax=Paraglaciecola sp. TaxID=1920173 RepID=UPI0030F4259E